jgi:Phytanoyl-CoA dioxygenase (PhyH)
MVNDPLQQLTRDGFTILPQVYSLAEIQPLVAQLQRTLEQADNACGSIRSRGGAIYAARNFLQLFPPAADVWRRPALIEFLHAVLGSESGLVRALYFDKPPEQTWSLPWHRDTTIAVQDNSQPSLHFHNPTFKAGVPHVEALPELLQTMLTLRIHLDAATLENGALMVIPGSHQSLEPDNTRTHEAIPIVVAAGDVLTMRPMLSHCSGSSSPGTTQHRRIIHLEFAASESLPDGYAWHTFQGVKKPSSYSNAYTWGK